MSTQEQATIQDLDFFLEIMVDQANEIDDIQKEMGIGRYEGY